MTNDKYYKVLIDSALDIGEQRESKIKTNQSVLKLYGMTGLRTKHFLNSLLSNGKLTFLELGIYYGASLISGLYENPEIKAYAVDDWHYSETDYPSINYVLDEDKKPTKQTVPWPTVKLLANENINRFNIKNVKVIEKNWVDLKKSDVPLPIDVVHIQPVPGVTEEQLSRILNSIYPLLQTTCIVVAEYYKTEAVRNAYAKWIKNQNLEVFYEQYKDSHGDADGKAWWGGLNVMVINKKDLVNANKS
jgi:hypothetical protein